MNSLQYELDSVADYASLEELQRIQEWIDILNFINN